MTPSQQVSFFSSILSSLILTSQGKVINYAGHRQRPKLLIIVLASPNIKIIHMNNRTKVEISSLSSLVVLSLIVARYSLIDDWGSRSKLLLFLSLKQKRICFVSFS